MITNVCMYAYTYACITTYRSCSFSTANETKIFLVNNVDGLPPVYLETMRDDGSYSEYIRYVEELTYYYNTAQFSSDWTGTIRIKYSNANGGFVIVRGTPMSKLNTHNFYDYVCYTCTNDNSFMYVFNQFLNGSWNCQKEHKCLRHRHWFRK